MKFIKSVFEFNEVKEVGKLAENQLKEKFAARPVAKQIFGLLFLTTGGIFYFAQGDELLLRLIGLFMAFFSWALAIWLELTIPLDSLELWPSQFKTIKALRDDFFKLENYPNIKDPSIGLSVLRWIKKQLTKN
jgi:hypothetical protein